MRPLTLFVPALLGALLAGGGAAQPAPPRTTFCDNDRALIACQDTLRALLVVVRFAGDTSSGPEWPDSTADGRPIPPRQLPPFARDLLAPTPEAVARTTPQDSSLSAYFYWQSKHGPRGPHVLFGDVWPRNARGEPEVFLSPHPASYYHRDQPERRGYGHLTADVLDSLVTVPGFDIGDYDYNRDGVVDHVFMVVKRDPAFRQQGWASLAGHEVAAARPQRTLRYWSPARRDSVRVDWSHSGSQSHLGNWANREMLIHEYGHRLFGMPRHTPVIGPRDNDVPFDVPLTDRGTPVAACSFNRMCGGPALYDGASHTLSAYELRRMGWAARTVLDPADGDRPGVAIRPLYTRGEVVLIPLRPGAPGDTLSVESRQRNNFFDNYPPYDGSSFDAGTVWRELGTTGLLVTLTRGDPMGGVSQYRYDYLPPDNELRRESRCEGPGNNCYPRDIYEGDMLRPGVATQLTPWTRPSVSGYTHYPEGFEPNWFALTNVRYNGGPDSTMAFDLVADAREGLTITSDSWMGAETSGQTLPGRFVVAEGATLTVAAGAEVTFGGGLRVEEGARLVVEEGAAVRFGPGRRLELLGVLEGGGFVEGR